MYKRYVDDIFCMSGNEKDGNFFFEFLNYRDKYIKITIEKEDIKFYHLLILLSKMKETVF